MITSRAAFLGVVDWNVVEQLTEISFEFVVHVSTSRYIIAHGQTLFHLTHTTYSLLVVSPDYFCHILCIRLIVHYSSFLTLFHRMCHGIYQRNVHRTQRCAPAVRQQSIIAVRCCQLDSCNIQENVSNLSWSSQLPT